MCSSVQSDATDSQGEEDTLGALAMEALLPAARVLFWPAVVIKSVRLLRRLLRRGTRRRPGVQPQALTATIGAAALVWRMPCRQACGSSAVGWH